MIPTAVRIPGERTRRWTSLFRYSLLVLLQLCLPILSVIWLILLQVLVCPLRTPFVSSNNHNLSLMISLYRSSQLRCSP